MSTLDFGDFVAHLGRELHLDVPDPVRPSIGLFDDLEVDSLGALELIVTVEDLAAIDVPPAEPPKMFTLGDAYEYYVQLGGDRPL